MKKELEQYSQLTIKLNKEKEILDEFLIQLNDLYNKLKENNDKINIINENNINLNKEINKIINKYLNVINIYLKIFFILFIITNIISVGILSNLNFVVMLLFSITSPIICIFIKVYITKILKQRYINKSKEIISLNSLIIENNIKLDKLKKKSIYLANYIKITLSKYNKQKRKAQLTQTVVKRKNNYHLNYLTCHDFDTNKCYKKIKTRKQLNIF